MPVHDGPFAVSPGYSIPLWSCSTGDLFVMLGSCYHPKSFGMEPGHVRPVMNLGL